MTLCAENVSLRVAGFDLLSDVSLTVTPGKITAIAGPNGAGKSSLLRILTADTVATSGTVSLNNRTLPEWSIGERARLMSVLPQHTVLDFPFTAREVVALGRLPHCSGAARDDEIVSEALALVDACYLERRYYTQMSGGEKQRVQLARVLAQVWEPQDSGDRFLLMDEPTTGLDLRHQQLGMDIVTHFASTGVGVLMVLHDLNLAARCADHLVVLNEGRIAVQGAPTEVLTVELLRDVFEVAATVARHPGSGAPLVIL